MPVVRFALILAWLAKTSHKGRALRKNASGKKNR